MRIYRRGYNRDVLGSRSAPASSMAEIAALLRSVRRRWMAVRVMRGVALAAAVALLALALLLAVDLLLAPADLVVAVLAAGAAGVAAGAAAWTFWPLRRGPSERRTARYVEERCPEFRDRLASAVDFRETPSPFAGRVLDDAARCARGLDLDRVVAARVVRRAVASGAGAAAALAALLLVGADVVGRIARSAWLYAAPFGATLSVEPGAARLVAGEPLNVRARLTDTLGAFGRSVPRVTVVDAAGGRSVLAMQPRGTGYAATLPPAAGSFTYRVTAAALESEDYAVTVLHAPRVERIDVAYVYPAYIGLDPRVETGGGDIFAPEGTVVTVTVHADKPVRDGSVRLAARGDVDLRRDAPAAMSASFEVTGDDTYRVALRDADGLSNRAAAEYVVRAVADDAPLVEVRRPGGDREITPLEEVVIEARAEDDFALARFDLVYAAAGGAERVVDLLGGESMARGAGVHTLYAEDLDVSPGDVISYYVRAGDARPARVRETRSDIYFLEVRPFEREFEDAPSQSSLSMDAGTVGQLAGVQKEIVAATWRLDGRPNLAADDADLVAVADAQAELRQTALGAAARTLQHRGGRAERQALAAAVDAMARAEEALRAASTGAALPPEMEALAALLRAQAAIRRTRVSRGGSGRSAAWQPQEDLSALFDRDLRREQETNYENRPSSPPAESNAAESDALRRVRELAERQAALGRAQDDLARRRDTLDDEEAARVLARLPREQEELREQAEALEREIEVRTAGGRSSASSGSDAPGSRRSPTSPGSFDSSTSRPPGSSTPSASGESSRATAVAESKSPESNARGAGGAGAPMRRALAELRRGQVAEAAERAREALERLRALERELVGADTAAKSDDSHRLSAELQAAEEVRRSLEALGERLGRIGMEPEEAGGTGRRTDDPGDEAVRAPDGGGRTDRGRRSDGELAAFGAAARELLRRLEALPDLRDALREARPGMLEDLARWAARPTGGGPALQAFEQDFAPWESLRDGVRQAIEAFEADRTRALQAAETEGRLDVGAGEAAPDGYRALVDRYYRALADHPPRRPRERR